MRFILLFGVLLLAACASKDFNPDYAKDSFTIGVNHCLHNTALPCR